MTLDEMKAEMESLARRIDAPLAAAILAEAKDDIGGRAYTVQVLHPLDLTGTPPEGYRLSLSLTAWFEPIRFRYVDREAEVG